MTSLNALLLFDVQLFWIFFCFLVLVREFKINQLMLALILFFAFEIFVKCTFETKQGMVQQLSKPKLKLQMVLEVMKKGTTI
jgi:hypothetical protein